MDTGELSSGETKAMKEFKDNLESKGQAAALGALKKYFHDINSVPLNIAVTGESGTGKSSFVNAIRGLTDADEQAADTGVVETTMEPQPYPHPNYPNVVVWDLPGTGTPNFQASTYLDQVNFSRYDFFIIVASERFKSSSVELAKEIQKMDKHFYFVRSKIDESIRAEQRKARMRSTEFDEDAVLKQIRNDAIKGLEKAGVKKPRVFLISNYELHCFDFDHLEETLKDDLPKHKRHIFTLAVPNATRHFHQKKKEALRSQIWMVATLSGLAAIIPGFSFAADLLLLCKELQKYINTFGLDDQSLRRLSSQAGVPVEDLKRCVRSKLKKAINGDIVREMMVDLKGSAYVTSIEVLACIPLIGAFTAGPMSIEITTLLLESCLEELSEDAQRVLERALQSS